MSDLFNISIATQNESLLDDSAYNQITNAFSQEHPISTLLEGALLSLFGDYYNIGIFILVGWVFYMEYQDHRSFLMPTLALVITGSFIFSILPAGVVVYLKLFAIMTMAGIIVKLYMDRR